MTEMFATIVYVLCFLASGACAWMLGRSYARNATHLLLWSAISFTFLAANNLVLVFDLIVWPDFDLRLGRLLLSLGAVVTMIWGFIWRPEEE